MTVEGQEEFQSVVEEDFDGRIQKRNGQKSPIRTVLDRKHVVGHFQRPHMNQGKLLCPALGMIVRVYARGTR